MGAWVALVAFRQLDVNEVPSLSFNWLFIPSLFTRLGMSGLAWVRTFVQKVSVLKSTLGGLSGLNRKRYIFELKSLILAQIERWRYA